MTKTDGTLWSWGSNAYGQLGQNNRTPFNSPVQIPGNTWSSIGGANNSVAAIKTDGTIWVWGYNGGLLGLNDIAYRSSPTQIPGTTWSSISGNQHSTSGMVNFAATKTDGTLWAWGSNSSGQLGQSNTTQYSSPIQIPGTTWSKTSVGFGHIIAIKSPVQ